VTNTSANRQGVAEGTIAPWKEMEDFMSGAVSGEHTEFPSVSPWASSGAIHRFAGPRSAGPHGVVVASEWREKGSLSLSFYRNMRSCDIRSSRL